MGITCFGKNKTTCGLCSMPQIQRNGVKTENEWKLKTTENKVFSGLRDYQCRKTFSPIFWRAVPKLPSSTSFLKPQKCQEMWCGFSEFYSFFWIMLAHLVTCFQKWQSNGCHWYFLGLCSSGFAQCFCQLKPFSWEKKSSRFSLNYCDTNERLPPAQFCGLNRLNRNMFSS